MVKTNVNNLYLKKKMNELAAMLKEQKGGLMVTLNKVKARFCLQEGVNPDTADGYLDILETSGLVSITSGGKKWQYNPDQEWDLFQVPVDNSKRSRR